MSYPLTGKFKRCIVLNTPKALNRFFACALLAACSLATAQQAPPANNAASEQQNQKRLLEEALADEGLVKLTAAGESFNALWQPDASGNALGAVLLFHGEGQNIDWPQTVGALRENLSLHGWATLSISLPDPIKKKPPERPVAEEPANQSADSASAEPETTPTPTPEAKKATKQKAPGKSASNNPAMSVEERVQARAQAGIDFLNQKGQYNIVFAGEGLGAARAAYFLDKISSEFTSAKKRTQLTRRKNQAIIQRPVRALVLINARNHIHREPSLANQEISDWLNDSDLPILDIFTQNHYLDQLEPQARKTKARQKHLKNYSQVQIMPPVFETHTGENILVKRIRGFLDRHARGVEINR